jgi:hypothetical protein
MTTDADTDYGPAWSSLSLRRKKFVECLFEIGGKRGAFTLAARRAGFGTETSSRNAMHVIGWRLAHDHRIQAALYEMGTRRLHSLAPAALAAIELMVRDPQSRHHFKACEAVLGRVHAVQTSHVVNVKHQVEPSPQATAAVLARIAELTAQLRVDQTRLPPMIDVTPVQEPVEEGA